MKTIKQLQEELRVAKAVQGISQENINRSQERKRLERELSELRGGYKKNISKAGSYIKQKAKVAGKKVGDYIQRQAQHMKENRDYWDTGNINQFSSMSSPKNTKKRIKKLKKKIKQLKTNRRIPYPPYPYPPYPGYYPRPRTHRVKHVKKVKKRKHTVTQRDPFSMF